MTQNSLSHVARRVALVLFAGVVVSIGASIGAQPPALAPSVQAAGKDDLRKGKDYDLASMEILRRVVVYIKDNYVDPKRIDPKEMFVSALEAIEKGTAEVMVEGTAKDGRVRVTCGTASRDFEFKDVDTLWMIPHRIRPVFEFIQTNLVATENKRDIEYAAINGMLSTLDPHSWLLKPENYREMKLQTKGEFGGLGFVIMMDEERLTVRKVLKNTPAARAGIKKGDHITRIDDESTINMELNEAVSKLRGKPGTEVKLFVRRDKEDEKPYRLTRDVISVESVTSRLLPDGVGYVRLASFAGTTNRELVQSIREMRQKAGGKLKGLVLDLRSNPGGLLDQAFQVADNFIEEGAIVTTSGMSEKLREPKMAKNDGNDREFPIAVLVNSESASASEIVAGALKNLNRAVIIGRQTFGKGSVQVLYDMVEPGTKDESALKLTIAQYLTPGDRSIQEIGVTPDIELLPARITKERVDLFSPPRLVREADLDKHFSNGFQPADAKKVVNTEKPAESMRYLKADKPKKEDGPKNAARELRDQRREENLLGVEDDADDLDDQEDDLVAADYPVDFARQLLLKAGPKLKANDREGLLQAARPFLAERRAEEDGRIQKTIEALGLDWSSTNVSGTPSAQVEFKASPARPVGGEFVTLTATVTNTGKAPFERLRAFTKCTAEKTSYQGLCGVLERREFLFGRVNPGEKKSWSTQFKVPNHLPATHERLTLNFEDAHGAAPTPQNIDFESLEAPKPSFAYSVQVMDKDNLATPGEVVDVQVEVRNTGTGRTRATYVSLRNQNNDKVFMKKGRISVGEIKPGESRTATVSLEVKPGADTSAGIPLKLEIGDRDVWEFLSDKISLPAAPTAPTFAAASGHVRIDKETGLLSAPLAGAATIAQSRKGALLPVVAKVGDFIKVEVTKGRFGYLPARDATVIPEGGNASGDARLTAAQLREPPAITFNGVDPTKSAVVVDGARFKLSGTATDPSGLMDLRVFVDNEKVFFHTPEKTAGKAAKTTSLPFNVEVPLKPGNNLVLVVAREDGEFSSQRTLVIHRSGGALAEQGTKPAEPRK